MVEHVVEGCQCAGKACSRCGVLKCLGAFYRRSNRKSGLQSHCRACQRAKNVEWYQENREKSLEHSKVWRQSNLEHALSYDQAYREKHKERYDFYRQSHRGYYRVYYHAHKEQDRTRRENYYRSHREALLSQQRSYYLSRKEEVLKRTRRYYHSHFEHYREYRWKHAQQRRIHNANRRARKTRAGGAFTVEQWQELKARYEYRCLCCGKAEPDIKLTPDHIVPISKGGTSDIGNIQPLCLSCNVHKMTKTVDYRKDNLK